MGRAYVGSTNNLKARWEQHARQLVDKLHSNSQLQIAFNYYGPRAFRLDLLERVDGDEQDLYAREQHWIDQHVKPFNIRPAGDDAFIKRRG